jgi:lysophospholipase L1-like esterase
MSLPTSAAPFRWLAAALLTVALVVAVPTHPARAGTVAPTKILLVGSSTTQGSSGDYTWRYRLWKHLTGAGVAVDFVGPDNHLYDNVHSTGSSFLETDYYADPAFDADHEARWGRFLGTFAGYPTGGAALVGADVTTYQPDYVVVMLGLNDLTIFPTRDPALIAADMQTFIANARAARPDVKFVLVAVQPTKGALDDAALAGRVDDYNQRLDGLATSLSTPTSPVAYVLQPARFQPDYNITPHDTYDGTHSNARGELRIAAAVADVLSARFGLGPAFPLVLDGVPTGPVLPFTLQCAPGNAKVTLTWTESPGATGYWYQRRMAGGTWDPVVYQLKITDSPLPNTLLTNGVTYEYRLQAAKWFDKGVYSNVCAATPQAPPGAVTGLSVSANGNGSVTLAWTPPAGTGLKFWVYQRDVTAGETAFILLPLPLTVCCTATIGQGYLLHHHVYEYRMSASTVGGEGPQSNTAQVTAYYDLPVAPTSLQAVATGGGSVSLTWSYPATVYFWVYARDVTAGQSTFTRGVYPTTNRYTTRSGLITGHVYEYQVTAANQAGEGPPSAIVQVAA